MSAEIIFVQAATQRLPVPSPTRIASSLSARILVAPSARSNWSIEVAPARMPAPRACARARTSSSPIERLTATASRAYSRIGGISPVPPAQISAVKRARARTRSGSAALASGSSAVSPAETLAELRPPPQPQGAEDPQAVRRVVPLGRPRQRCPKVVPVVGEPAEPRRASVGVERRLDQLRVVGEVGGMTAGDARPPRRSPRAARARTPRSSRASRSAARPSSFQRVTTRLCSASR